MTLQEALTILTIHQQWRQGADIEMAEPKVITEALDVLLNYHTETCKENLQVQISDEEIEKGAKEWYNKEGAYSASAIALKTWVYAIKWYREQVSLKADKIQKLVNL